MVAIELKPQEVIVPVLGRDSPAADLRLLGTGSIISIVGDGSILLTADHVIAPCEGDLFVTTLPDELVELEIDAKDTSGLRPIDVIERDVKHDLALLRVNGYWPSEPLPPWFDFPLHENWDVLTHECNDEVPQVNRGNPRCADPGTQHGLSEREAPDR